MIREINILFFLKSLLLSWLLFFLPYMVNGQKTNSFLLDESLVIETESLSFQSPWQIAIDTSSRFEKISYIYSTGEDKFNSPGSGIINIQLNVIIPGVYTVEWRSKVGKGDKTTDFNDTWLRFPDANSFYGRSEDNHIVYPHGSGKLPTPEGSGTDGWFKVYASGSLDWTWTTSTSDNDGHAIKVEFLEKGVYNMQLSTRSTFHFIDKIALFKEKTTPIIYAPEKEYSIKGEHKRWHTLTIDVNGPQASETDRKNPFTSYAMITTFIHESGAIYTVNGFFAACGNAANNGCESGNVWRTHFVPDRIGKWSWKSIIKEEREVDFASEILNNHEGEFLIYESDKLTPDNRSKERGRLQYVGQHYLKYAGTNIQNPNGNWFFKVGADATENTLDYYGFDGTPNRGNRRKTWVPHAIDYDPISSSEYNWSYARGSNILGMLTYLSHSGLNAFSFLTFSASGDDENVFPHLIAVPDSVYFEMDKETQWNKGIYHTRFDCSKLDQWEKVFSYADKLGLYLHFKLGEEENECKLDEGNLGLERKLYYKELIARFGHHLCLNWNIGEENGPPIEPFMTHEQRLASASYFKTNDPYHNHIVVHTRPDQKELIYSKLLGNANFTGISVQSHVLPVHDQIIRWVSKSDSASYRWVVANDEQGTYKTGVTVDANYKGQLPSENIHPDNRADVRAQVLWATLMAGGAGVEYYFGYETGCSDLDCQDHRTRETKWKDGLHAISFFEDNLLTYVQNMKSDDSLTDHPSDFVFTDNTGIWVVYIPDGKSTNIKEDLSGCLLSWFNPTTGSYTKKEQMKRNFLIPPTEDQDWVALINGRSK